MSTSFKELAQLLESMGVSWKDVVQTALSTMDPGLTEAERVQRLAQEFRRRAGPADAQLAAEQVRAAHLLSTTPPGDALRPQLMEMVLAFTEQREGLQLLARYFDQGDAQHLQLAQDKVRQGMERAREAAAVARQRLQGN